MPVGGKHVNQFRKTPLPSVMAKISSLTSLLEHAPAIVLAVGSFSLGGLLMSRNFSVQKGEYKFSSEDDAHSLARLEKHYESRAAHLKGPRSLGLLRQYESGDTRDERKRAIVNEVVDLYLGPTFYDRLFGHDIVIVNDKGKPTLMRRAGFDEVSDA